MEQNIIYQSDCLQAIDVLQKTHAKQVRLIYIDPPFFSGTNYTLKRKSGSTSKKAPDLEDIDTYSDKWEGGLSEYLEFMKVRLQNMKGLLRQDGSIWVHLDWHVSHYIKTIMDEIYGYDNFVNEIIWKRTNSPKAQSRGFGSQHDVILVYAIDRGEFRINPIYREHDERSLKPYSYRDDKGKFRLIEIEAQGIQRTAKRKQFEWRGRTAPFLYRQETLDDWWNNDLIYTSKNGRYTKKQYLSEVPGILVSDLWLDIAPIQGSSKEYSGFLTQKPKALLSRIIKAASDERDLVADFFAGSGTTAIAAENANRQWITCDISNTSIDLLKDRLDQMKAKPYAFAQL